MIKVLLNGLELNQLSPNSSDIRMNAVVFQDEQLYSFKVCTVFDHFLSLAESGQFVISTEFDTLVVVFTLLAICVVHINSTLLL